jgi:O-acetyl-ADP-ribose deacetylase (regulator of RNase III)
MSIFYKKGNLFESNAEAIVNTVNCVGIMGKGVALEFKKRWPDNYAEYKKLCQEKKIRPGHVFVFDTCDDLFKEENVPHRYLINFPTKDHWRSKSKFSYIDDGLDDFIIQLQKLNIKTVALPPLGCGNGGLDWTEVKMLLEEKLSFVDDIDFYIYGPKEDISIPEHESIPSSEMTKARAILVKTISELELYFGGYLTRISLQKIVYFLQVMGFDYGMSFSRNTHGPYSEELHEAFKAMDKQGFIVNYISDEPRIKVPAGALADAFAFLETNGSTQDNNKVQKLSLLIEGYESPFGMELLSSVHYLVEHENLTGIDQIIDAVKSWNDHKNNQFSDDAIKVAHQRLQEDEFIS